MVAALKIVLTSLLLPLVALALVVRYTFRAPEVIPWIFGQLVDVLQAEIEYVDEDDK